MVLPCNTIGDDFDEAYTLVRFSLSGAACRQKAASGAKTAAETIADPQPKYQNTKEIPKYQRNKKDIKEIPKYQNTQEISKAESHRDNC